MNGEDGDLLLGSLLITAVIGVMYIIVVGATSTKPLMIQRVMDIIKWINLLSLTPLTDKSDWGGIGYKKQGSRGLEWRGVEETGNTHDVRDPE
ncbi:hypothetical protein N7471_007959 [Penicillium samsonianum]|uniref:uncharacterized protein n=1 Tax=Penicillium samsonianum TaxID=1882272 RepID=UPI002546682B|nr:uncharacterized protein N7471_007959 [Penicillium samsonianum]KAJ6132744.1 hypothetical protein N7471_007959 [Penicillium samsonianum]